MGFFVHSSIELVRRDELYDEGALRTVDRENFEAWVRRCSCQCLVKCRENEKNSIAIMDNASAHVNDKIRDMIEAKASILLRGALNSLGK